MIRDHTGFVLTLFNKTQKMSCCMREHAPEILNSTINNVRTPIYHTVIVIYSLNIKIIMM